MLSLEKCPIFLILLKQTFDLPSFPTPLITVALLDEDEGITVVIWVMLKVMHKVLHVLGGLGVSICGLGEAIIYTTN